MTTVFGFVCKLCTVFIKDKPALQEHVKGEGHLAKFTPAEEERLVKEKEEAEKKAAAEAEKTKPATVAAGETVAAVVEEKAVDTPVVKAEAEANGTAAVVAAAPEVKSWMPVCPDLLSI